MDFSQIHSAGVKSLVIQVLLKFCKSCQSKEFHSKQLCSVLCGGECEVQAAFAVHAWWLPLCELAEVVELCELAGLMEAVPTLVAFTVCLRRNMYPIIQHLLDKLLLCTRPCTGSLEGGGVSQGHSPCLRGGYILRDGTDQLQWV